MTYSDDQIKELIAWAKSLGDPNFTLSVPGHAKTAFRALADALEHEHQRAETLSREAAIGSLGQFDDLMAERDELREQVENQAHNLRAVLSTLRHVKDILNNSRYVGRARVASRILSRALDTEKGVSHADWCHTVIGCSSPGHCSCDVAFTEGGAS
jgi:hypothetical protein